MNIVILAAGDFPRKAYPLYILDGADAVVCCDGALQTALRRGVKVDAVVGDMDSVSPSVLKRFKGKTVKVSEQETNDLTKALNYVISEYPSVSEITILGATGKREAHTLGNLSLLMEYEKEHGFWERGITTVRCRNNGFRYLCRGDKDSFLRRGSGSAPPGTRKFSQRNRKRNRLHGF